MAKKNRADRRLKNTAVIAFIQFVKESKKKGGGSKYPLDMKKRPLFKAIGRS